MSPLRKFTAAMDYSKTLNLPRTIIPMKANLPVREPQILSFWEDNKISALVSGKQKGKPKRILHDGPPYSNGRIHLGQALNKILKDIVVKFWILRGHDSPYVPGWDTHGLPNELEAIKNFKLNRRVIEPIELRKKCRESALSFVDIQREQFKRLGVAGDWDHPYLTLDHEYEAKIVEAFGAMAENGYVYRGKKPVYWCPTCETSLAEAEIEYKDKTSPSIYVKFPLSGGAFFENLLKNGSPLPPGKILNVLIWTTTPWTLPGNVAVALHPEEKYSLAAGSDGGFYFLAQKRIEAVEKASGVKFEVLESWRGSKAAEDSLARHPFLNRDSVLICENYVTMEEGTGCVHTAPGHGVEDFAAGVNHHLPVLVPVSGQGVLTEEAGPFAGLKIDEANRKIPERLKETGMLLGLPASIQHSYPHCWRCRNPVIFRATEQWFVAVDHRDLRQKALASIAQIGWYPGWGQERMRNTLRDRPDWCISRQRTWGVPLPVFYCEKCGQPVITKESIEAVKSLFLKEGADAWYSKSASGILPPGFACLYCKSAEGFCKETDIFDVWYESGVSHLAVLETRSGLVWPSRLYLEGPDQHRGWFQVSLLTAMAVKGTPPYKEVLTHGWTLDLEGRAMHKSLGNVLDPMDIVNEHGADVLRLYFASVDFKSDVRIGDKSLKDVGEAYRKIRNTCRFMAGNLYDFHPEKNKVSYAEMEEIDRWALMRLWDLAENALKFYENYDFHLVYYHVLNYCAADMSAVYLDVLKDRLYTFAADSRGRRSAQTALYYTLLSLIRILSPVLTFTAEDLWQALPLAFKDSLSVRLAEWPALSKEFAACEAFRKRWEKILEIKNEVYLFLEDLRNKKIIRQSLEAYVSLSLPAEEYKLLADDQELLKEVLIVSKLGLKRTDSPKRVVAAGKVPGEKCARCWHYEEKLSSGTYPGLCGRCLPVVEKLSPV